MLSKDDVDKMVREAAEHADEDAERRRQAETRNEADALVFQADRLVADLGDKLSEEEKTEIGNKTEAVREALKGTDAGAIDSTKQQLTEVLQRVGTKAYEASGTPGDGNGTGGSPDGEAPEAATEEEGEGETIEGEYKEV